MMTTATGLERHRAQAWPGKAVSTHGQPTPSLQSSATPTPARPQTKPETESRQRWDNNNKPNLRRGKGELVVSTNALNSPNPSHPGLQHRPMEIPDRGGGRCARGEQNRCCRQSYKVLTHPSWPTAKRDLYSTRSRVSALPHTQSVQQQHGSSTESELVD